jgi:fatty acid desaturase
MLLILRCAVQKYGLWNVIGFYGIPWLLVNHWIVAITFLHHTDPKIPHYRANEWSYVRGAIATMDRDFLGNTGKFFLHGISHYHIVHHFFPKMPFCMCAFIHTDSELTFFF